MLTITNRENNRYKTSPAACLTDKMPGLKTYLITPKQFRAQYSIQINKLGLQVKQKEKDC